MKRIGILTFHYADNHGAVLQAYALRKIINRFSGCHAEIINYVPKGYGYPVPADSELLNKKRRKREKFNDFLSENCGVNYPIIHTVAGNEYDVYVVGSDQVWNVDIPEAAADYEYFLPHLNDEAKRIAYSASIGQAVDDIDRDLFQRYLPKFEKISLREKSYIDIISELSGKRCEYTLDPVMLLNSDEYEKLVRRPDFAEKSYLLYFWYDLGDGGFGSVETVNMLARKYNLSVKHTFSEENSIPRQMLVNDGGDVLQEGPGEFLWYIKNAHVIITNSFHGALFSILFKKPFYIYYPNIRRTRQENIVNLFQLQDRVIQGYISPDKLNLEIDYASIYSNLEKERERSISYLKNAIGIYGDNEGE